MLKNINIQIFITLILLIATIVFFQWSNVDIFVQNRFYDFATTKVPCPHDIVHYGGSYPDVKVLDAYPKDFLHKSNVRCWPAGHASGGFALMSLYFLFKTPKNKKRALIVAIVIGWIMGLYKMLLGDHYLSHTIVTMLLSWLLILIVVKIVYRKDKSLEKVA
ncbi:MAG: phosphatase PAP2 family protein [Sulfurovaceae bacterium]